MQRPTLRPAQPHGGVFLVCRTAGAGGWDVAAVDSFLCRAHQHGLNASLRPAECRCTHGAARISSSRIMSTRPGSALRSRPFRAGWLMVACGKSKRLRLTVRTDPTDRTGAVNSARGASCRLLGAAAPRAAEARPAAGGGGSWGQSDLHSARDRKVSWRGSRGDVLGSTSPPNCRYMEMRPVAPHIWCPDPILSALARRQRPVALSR